MMTLAELPQREHFDGASFKKLLQGESVDQ